MLQGNTLPAVSLCIRLASSFLLMSLTEVCIEHKFFLLLALRCYLRVVRLTNYLGKLRALSLLVFHLLEVFVVCRIEYEHIFLSHLWKGVLRVDDWFEKLSMIVLFSASLESKGRVILWMIRDLPNGGIWATVLTRIQRMMGHDHAARPAWAESVRIIEVNLTPRCGLISEALSNDWRIVFQFFVEARVYIMHCLILLFGWNSVVWSLMWLRHWLHVALLRLWWVFSRRCGSLFAVIYLGWCSCPCTRLQFAKLNHAIFRSSLRINRGHLRAIISALVMTIEVRCESTLDIFCLKARIVGLAQVCILFRVPIFASSKVWGQRFSLIKVADV